MVRSTPTSASTARSAWPVSTPAAAYASVIRAILSPASAVSGGPAPASWRRSPERAAQHHGREDQAVDRVRGKRAVALDRADEPHRGQGRRERGADAGPERAGDP